MNGSQTLSPKDNISGFLFYSMQIKARHCSIKPQSCRTNSCPSFESNGNTCTKTPHLCLNSQILSPNPFFIYSQNPLQYLFNSCSKVKLKESLIKVSKTNPNPNPRRKQQRKCMPVAHMSFSSESLIPMSLQNLRINNRFLPFAVW